MKSLWVWNCWLDKRSYLKTSKGNTREIWSEMECEIDSLKGNRQHQCLKCLTNEEMQEAKNIARREEAFIYHSIYIPALVVMSLGSD